MVSTRQVLVLSSIIAALVIFSVPSAASAASYNLTTDKETFDSTDVGVNGAQATISFPKDILQVTSLDKSSSAFGLWLQEPAYSNESGQVTFIGGSLSGISGKALQVLRIVFKVKGAGPVSIIFSDGAVTASDGSGTNVLSAMNGLQLTSITTQNALLIKPPQIVRPTVAAAVLPLLPTLTVPLYPDPTAWYATISKFIVQWELPREVTDVATAIDQRPIFDPTVSEGLFNNKTFSPLSDGIWYLHVRFKNSVGWGPTAHYRIGIDSAPPLAFAVSSPDGLTTANVAPTIVYAAKDQPSGIGSYNIVINGVVATTTSLSTYTLPPQAAGKQSVVVQAVDKAGNMTESRVTLQILEEPLITIAGIRITQFSLYISLIIALIAGGMLGWYVGLKERQQRRRRITIAQRDIHASFGIIEKDVDNLLRNYNGDVLSEHAAREMKAVLERIAETIEKDKQYVVQNIEEIET
jgi:hypothetical protein